MISSLLDLHARLSDRLLSQNLILDDVNITDSAYDSNSSIGDSGNILFPLNCLLDEPSLEACDVGYVTLYGSDLFTQSCGMFLFFVDVLFNYQVYHSLPIRLNNNFFFWWSHASWISLWFPSHFCFKVIQLQ